MIRLSRMVSVFLIALIAAGSALTGHAQEAPRGCYEGNPSMTCPLVQCLALSNAVHAPDACSVQGYPLSACRKISGCQNLKQALARWQRCVAARTTLMVVCFGGGDSLHQALVSEARRHVLECETRIALPEPVGCAETRCK